MVEAFAVLVCSRCQKSQEEGNYCGQCGARLEVITVTPEMIHERTISEAVTSAFNSNSLLTKEDVVNAVVEAMTPVRRSR